MEEEERKAKERKEAKRVGKALEEAGYQHNPWVQTQNGSHWCNVEPWERQHYPPRPPLGQGGRGRKSFLLCPRSSPSSGTSCTVTASCLGSSAPCFVRLWMHVRTSVLEASALLGFLSESGSGSEVDSQCASHALLALGIWTLHHDPCLWLLCRFSVA